MIIKKILIKLLFRLIDGRDDNFQDINNKRIEEWLAQQHQDIGRHEYMRQRNLQLLIGMGEGVEHESYWIMLGRRLELKRFASRCRKAFELKIKRSEQIKRKIKKGAKK